MTPLLHVVALALALWLVVGQPVSGVLRSRREVPLLRRYATGAARQWALALLAVVVTLVWVGAPPQALGLVPVWRREVALAPRLAEVVLLALVAVLLLRWDRARRPGRSVLDAALRPVAPLLPRSPRERLAYAGVAVTAGVTEELLYRGYLVWFLALTTPLSYPAVLVASSVAFGLGHAYQGVRAVLLTGAMGWLLAQLAYSTGSLLWPVVLHVLVDLRVLLLLPRRVPVPA